MSNRKNKKNTNYSKKSQKDFKSKMMVFVGVVIFGALLLYLMYFFFVKNNNTKINMSTDKRIENISVESGKDYITTQKYVSDLNYSMRYDIDSFKVFKYGNRDYYRCLFDDRVVLEVQISTIPSGCSNVVIMNDITSCLVRVDKLTDEYYYYKENDAYKITVKKSLDQTNINKLEKLISYMLNSFSINN